MSFHGTRFTSMLYFICVLQTSLVIGGEYENDIDLVVSKEENLIKGLWGGDQINTKSKYMYPGSVLRGNREFPARALASIDLQLVDWSPDTSVNKLTVCQGDCDSDFDCDTYLECFDKVLYNDDGLPGCSGIPSSGVDYCFDPRSLQNLALAGKASQSCEYDGRDAPANLAINGIHDATGDHSQTCYDPGAFWEVDLGGLSEIASVIIWNRIDCCQSRLIGGTVEILNEFRKVVVFVNLGIEGNELEIVLPFEKVYGRYVRVRPGHGGYLHLEEVEVFGYQRQTSPSSTPSILLPPTPTISLQPTPTISLPPTPTISLPPAPTISQPPTLTISPTSFTPSVNTILFVGVIAGTVFLGFMLTSKCGRGVLMLLADCICCFGGC